MKETAYLLQAALISIWWVGLVVRPMDERDMAVRFGDSYLEYPNRVSCWLPTPRKNAG
jgi:protein-S-isoprenylcysteine O-methyltransferase Ste14